MAPRLDQKGEADVTCFENVLKLLTGLKDQVLQSISSSSSLVTLEFLTQKFRLLESTTHNELAPLAKFAIFMPTDALHVVTRVQTGERRSVGGIKGEGGS